MVDRARPRGDGRAPAARLSRPATDHGGARVSHRSADIRRWFARSSRRWPRRRRRRRWATLTDATRHRIRAYAAATDNIGLFFGEDIFIAIGSILLIRGFLEQNGIRVEPTSLAVWAIPTAICAFVDSRHAASSAGPVARAAAADEEKTR